MLVRELPPLRQSLLITNPSGRTFRWAEDEPDPNNVPSGMDYGSTMPGGWEHFGCVLPRKPERDYSDIDPMSTITVIGPSGGVDGEFRIEATPKTSGDHMSISPEAVGWQANLSDDQSASMIYVDRDINNWRTEMSGVRRAALAAGGYKIFAAEIAPDDRTGLQGLKVGIPLDGGGLNISEPIYDAGAMNRVAAFYYDYISQSALGVDANWALILMSLPDDAAVGAGESTGDIAANTTLTGYYTPATARRYFAIQHYYATNLSSNAERFVLFRKLGVYGDHNLTRRGSDPGGFFASDAVAHAVGRWATKLRYTTGVGETIQPSTFVIPQMAFRDLTTAAEMIKEMTKYELLDWAVWEGKKFYLNTRNARGRKWRTRVGPAKLRGTGQQVDETWNSVMVQYQDVDGSLRTVGPPTTNADATSSLLVDSDPSSPLNASGVNRRCLLKMGVSTSAGAIQIGARFLEQSRLINTSGQATLTGHVMDDSGVLHPYFSVRAGDQISFIDSADPSYRRIVRANVSRSAREVAIDLDAPPQALQALLERLSVVIQPLGFS